MTSLPNPIGDSSPALRPTVLVVDDEELNRDLVERQLKGRYRVLQAKGGTDALRILEQETVDLVLLDVMMPERSGYDVCAEIKLRQEGGFLPVIFLTALSRQEDRNVGLSKGADDFLTKPVNGTELRLRVEAFLRLREQDRIIREQFEKLRRLEALKDDLVSITLHDLRNPLAGLLGYLDLLDLKTRDERFADLAPLIDKIRGTSGHLREILEGMLQVRLLEENQLPLARLESDLAAIAAEAKSAVEGAGLQKGIDIRVTSRSGSPARVDANLMRRAVENLLSNAVKYSPQDETIDIVIEANDVACEIRVCDRGEGIPDALKPELFKKFGSIEAKGRGTRRGIGLGLYMVRLVAEAHEGEARVADREGGGTVFSVRIPNR
ncbi:MAG: response regulator [Planctomycetota bacterium]|nr:response regulator [Planctomycetota bacterium]